MTELMALNAVEGPKDLGILYRGGDRPVDGAAVACYSRSYPVDCVASFNAQGKVTVVWLRNDGYNMHAAQSDAGVAALNWGGTIALAQSAAGTLDPDLLWVDAKGAINGCNTKSINENTTAAVPRNPLTADGSLDVSSSTSPVADITAIGGVYRPVTEVFFVAADGSVRGLVTARTEDSQLTTVAEYPIAQPSWASTTGGVHARRIRGSSNYPAEIRLWWITPGGGVMSASRGDPSPTELAKVQTDPKSLATYEWKVEHVSPDGTADKNSVVRSAVYASGTGAMLDTIGAFWYGNQGSLCGATRGFGTTGWTCKVYLPDDSCSTDGHRALAMEMHNECEDGTLPKMYQ